MYSIRTKNGAKNLETEYQWQVVMQGGVHIAKSMFLNIWLLLISLLSNAVAVSVLHTLLANLTCP